MGLGRAGDWARARSMLGAGAGRIKSAMNIALRQEAHALRNEIVQGLTSQAPGGDPIKPPSALTIATRQLKGFGGSKALLVRGDLRNAIAVVVVGDEAFIGVPRKAKSKGSKGLVDVAQLQEFGGRPVVIPITAKMRRFLFALLRKAGVPPRSGKGRGVVVVQVPARPFLRPAFEKFRKGAHRRFLGRVARGLGM